MPKPIEVHPDEIRDVDPTNSYVHLTDGRSFPRGRIVIVVSEIKVVYIEETQPPLDSPEQIG